MAGAMDSKKGASGSEGTREPTTPKEREAISEWDGEGGAARSVRGESGRAGRKARKVEREKSDSIAKVDDNATKGAAAAQSAEDGAAEAAGSPAEEGGQG